MRPVNQVVAGQYDHSHGIDIVAVRDGKPLIVEVKSIWSEGGIASLTKKEVKIPEGGVEKAASKPAEGTLEEALDMDSAKPGGMQQMDDAWVRDRWLALIQDERIRLALDDAGVHSNYLDTTILYATLDAPAKRLARKAELWQNILQQKHVVVVSHRPAESLIDKTLVEQATNRNIRVERIFTIKVNKPW